MPQTEEIKAEEVKIPDTMKRPLKKSSQQDQNHSHLKKRPTKTLAKRKKPAGNFGRKKP
jgi:hypothetical protein